MTVSCAIRKMLEAGLTIEQALIAAEAFEGELEPTLTKRQARNKRYYENHKTSEKRLNKDDIDVSDAQDGIVFSSPEVSPQTPLPNPHQSIPPSPPKGGSSPSEIQQIVDAYAAMAKRAGLPVPRSVDERRRRAIAARIRENGFTAFVEAIGKVGASRFCCGENDRGWRVDIDFLSQAKNFTRILEGKYDNRPSGVRPPQHPPKPKSEFMQRQDSIKRELEVALGQYPDDDKFAGSGPAFDLENSNWRAH